MKRRRRHTPEQIIRKLREADRLLVEGREVPEVASTWRSAHITEAWTYDVLRGGEQLEPADLASARSNAERVAPVTG
jgi:hypothetical protein